MLERRRIIELSRTGAAEVLITLVRAEGSSYRRPGARILLAAGNTYAGTISGGCLEAEVTRKAAWIVRNGPAVQRYSTLFDDTADIPYGLGCGGTVDLLFEPANTPEAAALLHALDASLTGHESTVQTWLPTPTRPLRRAILAPTGVPIFTSPSLSERDRTQANTSATVDHSLYTESIQPPQRLVLLGAGDDARPVVSMAALLGWNVVVADGRAQLARPARFPEAQSVQTLPDLSHCARDLAIMPTDAVVLMTHSYEQDRDCLASLLAAPTPRYIGVLGARHRTSLLVSDVSARIGHSIASCCDRIHAPIGLDLGGDGPEAIALAILAEIQAGLHGKLPASRRLTAQGVEAQLGRNLPNRYQPVRCASGSLENTAP